MGTVQDHKIVRLCIRENFPYRRSLTDVQILEKKTGNTFRCIQCNFQVPEKLRTYFSKIFSTFGNTLVSKTDLRNLMEKSTAEERCPILRNCWYEASHYKTYTDQSLLFCLPWTMSCLYKKILSCLIHHKDCFNSFVQSAVDARSQRDQNPISVIESETKYFLTKGFFRVALSAQQSTH